MNRNDGVALQANKGKDLPGRNPHPHSPLNSLLESFHTTKGMTLHGCHTQDG